MSITITGEFRDAAQAQMAAQRLRRRGYAIREPVLAPNLIVAHPYGVPGGNTQANSLMASLPPMAENSLIASPRITVLTDDTREKDCRALLEALGGRLLP